MRAGNETLSLSAILLNLLKHLTKWIYVTDEIFSSVFHKVIL